MKVRVSPCVAAIGLTVVFAACRSKQPPEPPVATPSFTINVSRAPLGSPVDVTYRFAVAPSAPPFAKNYRVMVHVLDSDDELMWTDDHYPPTPTREWKPGQDVEYTRTIFLPIYPYLGKATIEMGLYAEDTKERLPLSGDDDGQRGYRVGTIELLPQTDNFFVVFRDGWQSPEHPEGNSAVEWQWTKKDATLSLRNPKRDLLFYLHADQPGGYLTDPQHVTVTLGALPIDEFMLAPGAEVIRKVPITAAQLGQGEVSEIGIHVDRTFIPRAIAPGKTTDPRELGIRVYHVFVQPR